MFSSVVRRGALWLTGGILATIVGAIVYFTLHQQVIAMTAGAIFAVAFGMAIEPVIVALTRRTGVADSSRLPQESPDDEIAHSGQATPAGVVPDHLPRVPQEQRHQHHGSRHAQ